MSRGRIESHANYDALELEHQRFKYFCPHPVQSESHPKTYHLPRKACNNYTKTSLIRCSRKSKEYWQQSEANRKPKEGSSMNKFNIAKKLKK